MSGSISSNFSDRIAADGELHLCACRVPYLFKNFHPLEELLEKTLHRQYNRNICPVHNGRFSHGRHTPGPVSRVYPRDKRGADLNIIVNPF